MKSKYKIEIRHAYYIAIVDKDGKEVDADWSFFCREQTKKLAEQMLKEVEEKEARTK